MYPWHTTNWQSLTSNHHSKRLAHGLTFFGANGIGKENFAIEFSQWLMCQQPGELAACGECKSCQLFKAQTNPDFFMIKPEEKGKAIKVDQIRALIEKLSLKGHGAGYRVIILSPADALNINASNSLLKTLEEPPENTVLILISEKPSQLMPTIRSRTQLIRFDLPVAQDSLNWLEQQSVESGDLLLKLSGGGPLAAKNLAEQGALEQRENQFKHWQDLANGAADVVEIAEKWDKERVKNNDELPLKWVTSWIMDMIKYLQCGSVSCMVNSDQAKVLQKLAGQVDLMALYGLLDRLIDSLRLVNTSANKRMLIEGLLIHWAGLKRINQ